MMVWPGSPRSRTCRGHERHDRRSHGPGHSGSTELGKLAFNLFQPRVIVEVSLATAYATSNSRQMSHFLIAANSCSMTYSSQTKLGWTIEA